MLCCLFRNIQNGFHDSIVHNKSQKVCNEDRVYNITVKLVTSSSSSSSRNGSIFVSPWCPHSPRPLFHLLGTCLCVYVELGSLGALEEEGTAAHTGVPHGVSATSTVDEGSGVVRVGEETCGVVVAFTVTGVEVMVVVSTQVSDLSKVTQVTLTEVVEGASLVGTLQ